MDALTVDTDDDDATLASASSNKLTFCEILSPVPKTDDSSVRITSNKNRMIG